METTNITEQTHAENMGDVTEVQGSMDTGKKTFTQEEVNSFIQSRISRMKSQATKEARAEYDQKLAELQAREMRLLVREQLHQRRMPGKLADVVTCTDENDLKTKLDVLQHIYGSSEGKQEEKALSGFTIGVASDSGNACPDSIRQAMGLK